MIPIFYLIIGLLLLFSGCESRSDREEKVFNAFSCTGPNCQQNTNSTQAPEANSTLAPDANSTLAPDANSTLAPEANSTLAPEANSTLAPDANSTQSPADTGQKGQTPPWSICLQMFAGAAYIGSIMGIAHFLRNRPPRRSPPNAEDDGTGPNDDGDDYFDGPDNDDVDDQKNTLAGCSAVLMSHFCSSKDVATVYKFNVVSPPTTSHAAHLAGDKMFRELVEWYRNIEHGTNNISALALDDEPAHRPKKTSSSPPLQPAPNGYADLLFKFGAASACASHRKAKIRIDVKAGKFHYAIVSPQGIMASAMDVLKPFPADGQLSLSMFISNTATCAMILPIGQSVILQFVTNSPTKNANACSRNGLIGGSETSSLEDAKTDKSDANGAALLKRICASNEVEARMAKALILSIAFGANIGGVGTPTGTAPNLVLVGMLSTLFPDADTGVNYMTWMALTVPLMCCCLISCWAVLSLIFLRNVKLLGTDHRHVAETMRRQAEQLPPMKSRPPRRSPPNAEDDGTGPNDDGDDYFDGPDNDDVDDQTNTLAGCSAVLMSHFCSSNDVATVYKFNISLVKACYAPLTIFNFSARTAQNTCNPDILCLCSYSYVPRKLPPDFNGSNHLSNNLIDRTLNELVGPLRKLALREEEVVPLKAIIILDPNARNLSPEAQRGVAELRDLVQDMLFHVVKELHPAHNAAQRFGNLLLLLLTISTLSGVMCENMQFCQVFGWTDPLLNELFETDADKCHAAAGTGGDCLFGGIPSASLLMSYSPPVLVGSTDAATTTTANGSSSTLFNPADISLHSSSMFQTPTTHHQSTSASWSSSTISIPHSPSSISNQSPSSSSSSCSSSTRTMEAVPSSSNCFGAAPPASSLWCEISTQTDEASGGAEAVHYTDNGSSEYHHQSQRQQQQDDNFVVSPCTNDDDDDNEGEEDRAALLSPLGVLFDDAELDSLCWLRLTRCCLIIRTMMSLQAFHPPAVPSMITTFTTKLMMMTCLD